MKDDLTHIDPGARRGRGALSNREGRFETHLSERFDDGWELQEAPLLRTEVAEEKLRKAITRNSSPDLDFDRSLNPYRGCEHGCIYCFARPSHAYLGMSPGLDFETRLIARPNAPQRLRAEISRPRYVCAPLAIGTNTDPYQPIEKTRRIMRSVLKVLAEFQHPVGIVTKGTLIRRDIDLIAPMAAQGLAGVGISITTLSSQLSRAMEPRVPGPAQRLRLIEELSRAGVPVRVMVSPIVPGLTDAEVESILQAAANAGAKAASYILLRLPGEVAELFWEWLAEAYPDRVTRVKRKMREMRGGEDYDPSFGTRMTGEGPQAELLAKRFELACKRLGLVDKLPKLRTDLFRVPPKPGDQLSLF
jgi:DNA repair photolyase